MSTSDFIALIASIAMLDQSRTGVLASITIAQAILESASGRSAPGNNLFGIKGKGQQLDTREFVNGEWITVKDGFRVYNSWSDSVRDHSDFLLENSRYARADFLSDVRSWTTKVRPKHCRLPVMRRIRSMLPN
jgi:flagellum-specific peptidoglycan hydrolase FlgJ